MAIPEHLQSHPLFSGTRWGAMSGERPRFDVAEGAKATHEDLVKKLEEMGMDGVIQTHGRYDEPERSVIIPNATREQMQMLGKMFGQESVIHSDKGQHELVYTNGKHEGASRFVEPGKDPVDFSFSVPDNNYTYLPAHGYFSINFDFSKDPEHRGPKVVKAEDGKVIPLNPPPPSGKRYRRKATVEEIPTDANSIWDAPGEPEHGQTVDPVARQRAIAGSISRFDEPKLVARGMGRTKNVYDYTHALDPIAQNNGYTLTIHHTPGMYDDYMTGEIRNKLGQVTNSTWAYPQAIHSSPRNEADRAFQAAFKNHSNWIKFGGGKMKKAWPKDEAENRANEPGFAHSGKFVSPAVATVVGDVHEEGGVQKKVHRGPVADLRARAKRVYESESNPDFGGEPTGWNRCRNCGTSYEMEDPLSTLCPECDQSLWADPEDTEAVMPDPTLAATQEPAVPWSRKWQGTEEDKSAEQKFWGDIDKESTKAAHPHAYPWHEGHTNHHQGAPNLGKIEGMFGLAKADLPKHENVQAAPVGVKTYAQFASPYGAVKSGTQSDLFHYPYHGKLNEIENLVKDYGYKTYYAGGRYGKPDLKTKNYNTGHLMVYDPSPESGASFGQEEYTKGWRQIHELAHALTYPELNKIYGEGRRMGKLGIHRTPNEALRAVHWEWLAAHKQRELGEKIGIHVPDETFNKELNTVMHDAAHRAVTGQFTEPSQEGFVPHSHKVPLHVALDLVRDHASKMGLQGPHDLVKRKSEPVIFDRQGSTTVSNEKTYSIQEAAEILKKAAADKIKALEAELQDLRKRELAKGAAVPPHKGHTGSPASLGTEDVGASKHAGGVNKDNLSGKTANFKDLKGEQNLVSKVTPSEYGTPGEKAKVHATAKKGEMSAEESSEGSKEESTMAKAMLCKKCGKSHMAKIDCMAKAELCKKCGKHHMKKAGKDENPCESGYEAYGMKEKNGKPVPNCAPTRKAAGQMTETLQSGEPMEDSPHGKEETSGEKSPADVLSDVMGSKAIKKSTRGQESVELLVRQRIAEKEAKEKDGAVKKAGIEDTLISPRGKIGTETTRVLPRPASAGAETRVSRPGDKLGAGPGIRITAAGAKPVGAGEVHPEPKPSYEKTKVLVSNPTLPSAWAKKEKPEYKAERCVKCGMMKASHGETCAPTKKAELVDAKGNRKSNSEHPDATMPEDAGGEHYNKPGQDYTKGKKATSAVGSGGTISKGKSLGSIRKAALEMSKAGAGAPPQAKPPSGASMSTPAAPTSTSKPGMGTGAKNPPAMKEEKNFGHGHFDYIGEGDTHVSVNHAGKAPEGDSKDHKKKMERVLEEAHKGKKTQKMDLGAGAGDIGSALSSQHNSGGTNPGPHNR